MIRKEVVCPICGKSGFFSVYVTEEKGKQRYRGIVYHRGNAPLHYICQLTEEDYMLFNSGKTREIWVKALEKWAMRQKLLRKGIKNLRESRWVRESVGSSNKINID